MKFGSEFIVDGVLDLPQSFSFCMSTLLIPVFWARADRIKGNPHSRFVFIDTELDRETRYEIGTQVLSHDRANPIDFTLGRINPTNLVHD